MKIGVLVGRVPLYASGREQNYYNAAKLAATC